jgi:hypothetical protein
MKQASFRAQSLFILLLIGISTLWGQQPPHAATSSHLMARIDPAESEVESGGGVKMMAIVSGGTPPYSYEWRNGEQLSPVTTAGISWSNLNRLGDRDIRLIVSDAAGTTVETHAAIHVHAARTYAPIAIPPQVE